MSDKNNVCVMLVPDKNYYLDSDNFLQLEYDYIYSEVSKIDNINFIDIRDVMELDDYYETDTHWRQEKLDKVVDDLKQKNGEPFGSPDFKLLELLGN